jgi:hypothetical protein
MDMENLGSKNSMDFLILMDCTGSMGEWMKLT